MECLRTVAKVIGGICDKNDLLGEQSIEMVYGLLDATRELLGKALTMRQREPVIEPALAVKSLTLLGGCAGPYPL